MYVWIGMYCTGMYVCTGMYCISMYGNKSGYVWGKKRACMGIKAGSNKGIRAN
jgi:hypothetical protein